MIDTKQYTNKTLEQLSESFDAWKDRRRPKKPKEVIPLSEIYGDKRDEISHRIRSEKDLKLAKVLFDFFLKKTIRKQPVYEDLNIDLLTRLVAHFSGIDRSRTGFYLFGKNGTLKTSVFVALRQVCLDVCQYYVPILTYGNLLSSFSQFGDRAFENLTQKEMVIDDLGFLDDNESTHFGSKKNILVEIVNHRHRMYKSHDYLTHFTSNVSRSRLEEEYRKGVVDRLFEMSSFHLWVGDNRRPVAN